MVEILVAGSLELARGNRQGRLAQAQKKPATQRLPTSSCLNEPELVIDRFLMRIGDDESTGPWLPTAVRRLIRVPERLPEPPKR